jgi:quercetin dioxygenase-like cupin family protein
MLRKFPAGYAPPMHKHPSVERVVVISGTIVVQYEGSDKKTLGPGSYSEIPPNTNHAVQCGGESALKFIQPKSLYPLRLASQPMNTPNQLMQRAT